MVSPMLIFIFARRSNVRTAIDGGKIKRKRGDCEYAGAHRHAMKTGDRVHENDNSSGAQAKLQFSRLSEIVSIPRSECRRLVLDW